MSVDKKAVRDDYQRGYSLRMLSAKYGVPKSTLSDWIKKYGWAPETTSKRQTLRDLAVEAEKEALNAGQDDGQFDGHPDGHLPADADYTMLRGYTLKLLNKANDLLELDDALAPRDLKSLSSMLLDVRTLMGILSPREAAEQEMRLLSLKKSMDQADASTEPVTVVFTDTEGAQE